MHTALACTASCARECGGLVVPIKATSSAGVSQCRAAAAALEASAPCPAQLQVLQSDRCMVARGGRLRVIGQQEEGEFTFSRPRAASYLVLVSIPPPPWLIAAAGERRKKRRKRLFFCGKIWRGGVGLVCPRPKRPFGWAILPPSGAPAIIIYFPKKKGLGRGREY